jgi:DNA-binding transcriptional LysR family regulator
MYGDRLAAPNVRPEVGSWKGIGLWAILLPAMATMDVDQLAAFVAVVRAGSFTAAAKKLGTQKAHVSRTISRLEKQMGVRLLQRSTRSLAVTEIGRELYERADSILAAIDDTAAAIQRNQDEPQGVLKLTCGVEFGVLVVNSWIVEYLRKYPRAQAHIECTNRVVDLIDEGFDLSIRVGALTDSTLSARLLGEIRYAFYASPTYLRGQPEPAHPKELAGHPLIAFAVSKSPTWRLVNGAERFDIVPPARLVLDNNIMACDAAAAGLGIAMLPRFQATPFESDGRLVEILKGWSRTPVPIHAVFASSRYLAPKVRAFIDLARTRMRDL